MIQFEIDGESYNYKNTLDDLSIKEYFELLDIYTERLEIPVADKDKYLDGTYNIEYYASGKEPSYFIIDKTVKIISYLTGISIDTLESYPELITSLLPLLEDVADTNTNVWKKCNNINRKKNRDKSISYVEDDYEWFYEKPSNWSFQQWVDSENASKQSILNPFLIAIHKRKKDSKSLRKYDRSHPDFDSKEEYWLNHAAKGNISTITSIISEMKTIRDRFPYIYNTQSAYPDSSFSNNTKVYNEYAGWNDVVLTLSENPYFDSPKGTLYAVRNSNCIDVLELLDWRRGKSFSEYEDYKTNESMTKKH